MLYKGLLSAAIALPVVDAGLSPHDSLVLLQRQADTKNGVVRGDVAGSGLSGIGMTAPVSARGYELVANLKNNDEMKAFIERVVRWEGRVVNDESELKGLVPYYSGTAGKQNLDKLKQELRQAAWVGEGLGRTAPLNEDGYRQVAKLKDRHHMMAFSRRILDAHRRKCSDEGSLIGMMPYFNGAVSVQNYERLRQELLSAPWAVDRSETAGKAPKVSMSAKAENVRLSEAKRDGRTQEFFSRVHSHVVGKEGLDGDPILMMIGEDAYLVDPKAGVKTPSILADEWGLQAHDPQAVAEAAKAKGVNLLLWSSDYKAVDRVLASATVPKSSRIRGWINGVEQDEIGVRDMNPSKALKLGLSLMWLQGGGWDGKEGILQFGTLHVAKTILRGSFLGSIADEVRTRGHGKSECPCVGIDGNIGEINITIDGDVASYPADVGSRCESWDDDRHPTACLDGSDPGRGTGFCAQEWCYVDACGCDSGSPMKATYLNRAVYKGRPLYYSYATCGGEDTYTKWHAQHSTEKNAVDKKGVSKDTPTNKEVEMEEDKSEGIEGDGHEDGGSRASQTERETESSSGEASAKKTDADEDGERKADAEGPEGEPKANAEDDSEGAHSERRSNTEAERKASHYGTDDATEDAEADEGGGKTERGKGERKASADHGKSDRREETGKGEKHRDSENGEWTDERREDRHAVDNDEGSKRKIAKNEEQRQTEAKNKKVDQKSRREAASSSDDDAANDDESTAGTTSAKKDEADEDSSADMADHSGGGGVEDEANSARTEGEKDVTGEAEPKASKEAKSDVPKIDADRDVKADGDAQVEVEMPAEEMDAALEAVCSAPVDSKLAGKSGCMCVGLTGLPGTVKVALGENSTADYPADVGGSCSSWDENRHPECITGDSVPDWCHESWCYVDPCSCNQKAVMSGKTSGYLPKSNFEGRPLYYSYKACGSVDLWTAKNNEDACINKDEKECAGDCLWSGSQCIDQQLTSLCDAEQGSSMGLSSTTKVLVAAVLASAAALL